MEQPPSSRSWAAWSLQIGMFICWVMNCAIGCFAFFVSFHRSMWDERMEELSDKICEIEADQCKIKGGSHRSLCYACHEEKLCLVMMLVSVYQVLFGLVGMSADCGFKSKSFGFTNRKIGRALLLIFIGSFSALLGNEYGAQKMTFVCGIISLVIGILASIYWGCITHDSDEDYHLEGGKQPVTGLLSQFQGQQQQNVDPNISSASTPSTAKLANRYSSDVYDRDSGSSGNDNFFNSIRQQQQQYWGDRDYQPPGPRSEAIALGSSALSQADNHDTSTSTSHYTSLRDQ